MTELRLICAQGVAQDCGGGGVKVDRGSAALPIRADRPGGVAAFGRDDPELSRARAGKECGLFPTFYIKLIALPRQARDKYGKTPKLTVFSQTAMGDGMLVTPFRK